MSNLAEEGTETFVLDVTVNDNVVALKYEIEKLTGGKLDILYNNAGASKSLAIFGSKPQSS